MKNVERATAANGIGFEETAAPANYFDEEATLLARRVVPIERVEEVESGRSGISTSQRSSYPIGFLAIMVVSAALAGAAGALAINFYTARNTLAGEGTNKQPAVTDAVAGTTRQAAVAPAEPGKAEPPNGAPKLLNRYQTADSESGAPLGSPSGSRGPTTASQQVVTSENQQVSAGDSTRSKLSTHSAQSKASRDVKERVGENSEVFKPVITKRDKSRDEADAERRDRESGKSRPRRSQPDGEDQQQVEGQQELNRIRDIFEGKHP